MSALVLPPNATLCPGRYPCPEGWVTVENRKGFRVHTPRWAWERIADGAFERSGLRLIEPRFRVLESEPVGGGAPSFVVEDWLDESDPVPVDPWFDTRAEAQAFADRLNRIEAEKGEP